ncbi:PLDc N-terminal domain-containing protein [candidate division KSB1 bacterium]|nr:PLDc N-terminal domain-containing protein [candidate division KSB1 bacterium]
MLKSLIALLIFIADVLAILSIAKSKASTVEKIIWILIIIILPFIGLVVWFFAGPGSKKI